MDTEYFQTIAEVAITLAGFSGLIATFQKPESGWTEGAITRISVLLYLTFSVLTFALLPVALLKTNIPTGYVWITSLLGWSCSVLGVVAVMSKRTKQHNLSIELPFLTRITVVVGVLYHLACVPLVFIMDMAEALLAIGLLWGLAYGGIVFYATLSHIWKSGESA
jgi:hypothetical protein